MKSDIHPYTEEEAKRFGMVLAKLGVPSFGPATGMELLRIVDAVKEVVKKNKAKVSPEGLALMQGYCDRIQDLCAVAASMQGAILEQMQEMIKGRE